jgi:hypothetical protein
MTRISARKAKTPAAAPTAEPRSSLVTFSVTSVLASSNSSRIRADVFSETSKTSSPTDFWVGSSCGGVVAGSGRTIVTPVALR